VHTKTILETYKVGDIVDIVVNGSVHKGMPYKAYHGKSGIVWNVTKRAIGVETNKLVGNRIIAKRLYVRIEHVQQSKSRMNFLNRVKENEAAYIAAKAKGEKILTKRQPAGPRAAVLIKRPVIKTVVPVKFVGLYQG
jgi:large subunit ribosomal protein L21e